jgi:hypothetical protein
MKHRPNTSEEHCHFTTLLGDMGAVHFLPRLVFLFITKISLIQCLRHRTVLPPQLVNTEKRFSALREFCIFRKPLPEKEV